MVAVGDTGKGGMEALNQGGKVRNGQILFFPGLLISPFWCDILKRGFYASRIKSNRVQFKIRKPEKVKNIGAAATAIFSAS